jgi:alkanesulfonate monooxygenase SsuD/methylene tetrahydromethanopterin reductase-like flavin-dependent oxidoreductase (luciferase family)
VLGMDIAIGLPSTIPGVDRPSVLEWARRAESRGFSSLGTIDRHTYPNLEPLTTLAAAGAVTERIGLATTILLAPTRNTAVLAKEAATVDVLSGGRLMLGVAPGGREPDFEVTGQDFHTRGKRFDAQLAELTAIWSGDEIGPEPARGDRPRVVIGGSVDKAFQRAAQYADGWIAGGSPPDALPDAINGVRQAWEAAGRSGEPYIGALAYFSLGDDAAANAASYLGDYYGFLGDYAQNIIDAAATDADTLKQYAAAFTEAGAHELFFFPASTGLEQVDLLADAVL